MQSSFVWHSSFFLNCNVIISFSHTSSIMYSLLIDPALKLTRCPVVEKIETIEYWDQIHLAALVTSTKTKLVSIFPGRWKSSRGTSCSVVPVHAFQRTSIGTTRKPLLHGLNLIRKPGVSVLQHYTTLRRPWSCPNPDSYDLQLGAMTNFGRVFLFVVTNQRYFP